MSRFDFLRGREDAPYDMCKQVEKYQGIDESKREAIKKKLREICEIEQRKLGLSGVKIDIDYDDRSEKGRVNFQNNKITIRLARCLMTLECAIENGYRSIRHELRHLWQYKYKKEHVEWWLNHMDYYDELNRDSKEYEYCTVEIDAEAYAYEKTSEEYQLDKTAEELETTRKHYYETRSLHEQKKEEERLIAIKKYFAKKAT